jgi:hypothetical protein
VEHMSLFPRVHEGTDVPVCCHLIIEKHFLVQN